MAYRNGPEALPHLDSKDRFDNVIELAKKEQQHDGHCDVRNDNRKIKQSVEDFFPSKGKSFQSECRHCPEYDRNKSNDKGDFYRVRKCTTGIGTIEKLLVPIERESSPFPDITTFTE